MILEIPKESIDTLFQKTQSESSEIVKLKVFKAWELQQKRFE
jgi:predicted ATPase with chaperone activity